MIIIYQNKSMWSVRAHGLSEHVIGQYKRHMVYQNKSDVSDLEIIYRYQLKVNHLSF